MQDLAILHGCCCSPVAGASQAVCPSGFTIPFLKALAFPGTFWEGGS